MDEEELMDSADKYMWEACVKGLASGKLSIENMYPSARKQLLEDVEHYKLTGEINLD